MNAKKIINNVEFDEKTPDAVCNIVLRYMSRPDRIRVFYGDSETGRDWMEEHDTMGRVGRSTGSPKLPLLVYSSRCYGGGAILTGAIVKITCNHRVLYQHPGYHQPRISTVGTSVFMNGATVANFKTDTPASRYVDFMTGQRNSK